MCAMNYKLEILKQWVFEPWFDSKIWLIQVNNSISNVDVGVVLMAWVKDLYYSNHIPPWCES